MSPNATLVQEEMRAAGKKPIAAWTGLWANTAATDRTLDPAFGGQMPPWQERVRLDESFYPSLIEHLLPLRETAIRQISRRSMAIDLYI